jgi:hypothetical protein
VKLVLRRAGKEVSAGEIRLSEYEPLEIEMLTARQLQIRPDVLLDGASIGLPETTVGEDGLHWRWNFRSESWCGRATLMVISDRPPVELTIRSTPSGSKYSEDEYERMIEWVLAFGASLPWGLAPGESAASEGRQQRLSATHPALIRHYLLPLLEQLSRVLHDPVVNQRRVDLIEPFRFTRAPAPGTLSWLASHPEKLRRIKHGDRHAVTLNQVRRETNDHPANRYVLTLVRRLRASFESTAKALMEFGRAALTDDLEKRRAEHLAARARDASNQLVSALEHVVLQDLEPGEMSEGVTQVFADHPAYGRFSKLARRLLTPGVQLDRKGDLASSLRRSWDLFEIYCLYKLIDALQRALGQTWTYHDKPLTHHVLSSPPEGRCWSASHPDGRQWALFYQQPFGHTEASSFTISRARRPDFVLAAFVGKRLERWILLDAKYRTEEASIHQALESMHIYRDSLRWRCDEGGGEQTASAGYLLVPAVADRLRRFAHGSYLARWQLGLLRIDDGDLAERLFGELPKKMDIGADLTP